MHLEFVVPGPPVSNQSPGTNRDAWRALLEAEAINRHGKRPALRGPLKGIILNFHDGSEPSLDLDNMSKPIFDAMQNKVYVNDRQIRQAELAHARIDAPFVIAGASKVLVRALRMGRQFVYVRVQDPDDPLPLPQEVNSWISSGN